MRQRRATVAVPQHAIDAQGREAQRWQDRLLAITDRVLADQHITMDTRSDFAWFRGQLARGSGEPLSLERLAQLDAEMRDCPVERKGWLRRPLEPADYDDPDEDEGYPGAVPGEVIREEPGQREPEPNTPLCETCLAAGLRVSAVARISSSVQNMIPERNVCLPHYQDAAAIIDRMTFANLYVIQRYGRPAPVADIIRVPAAGLAAVPGRAVLPAGKAGPS